MKFDSTIYVASLFLSISLCLQTISDCYAQEYVMGGCHSTKAFGYAGSMGQTEAKVRKFESKERVARLVAKSSKTCVQTIRKVINGRLQVIKRAAACNTKKPNLVACTKTKITIIRGQTNREQSKVTL